MKLKIEINMDNSAFGEDGYQRAIEVDRILTDHFSLVELLEGDTGTLGDSKGNKVGEWRVEP